MYWLLSMTLQDIISVQNISKIYQTKSGGLFKKRTTKDVHALTNLSFQIKDGEFIGLLGPNGAGKTTLIKILTLLLLPTSGTFTVNGFPGLLRNENNIKSSIGAMLMGERGLYWKLTGRENLEYFCALYHLPAKLSKERIYSLLSLMHVENIADRPVETYSSGQKMKFAFLRTLVADPPILILDEPTVAMDVQGARELRKIVKELHEDQHKTVLYSTHIMHEAEELSDRVLIIDRGQIVDFDTVDHLKTSLNQDQYITIEGIFPDIESIVLALQNVTGVKNVVLNPVASSTGNTVDKLHISVSNSRNDMPLIIKTLLELKSTLTYLSPEALTLEDVFIARTGRSLSQDTQL